MLSVIVINSIKGDNYGKMGFASHEWRELGTHHDHGE